MEASELLALVRESVDPMTQHRLFTEHEALLEHPEVRDEWLWWNARYTFADKKRTRMQDRFVWLLMFLATWGQQGNYRRAKELHRLYDETILTEPMDAAMASSDRLFEQLKSACALYADTIREGPSILGLMRVKDKSPDHTNARVARDIVRQVFLPLGTCCRDRRYADVLVRALAAALVERYAGIRPHLAEAVERHPDADCRAFLLGCLHRATDELYGGKA